MCNHRFRRHVLLGLWYNYQLGHNLFAEDQSTPVITLRGASLETRSDFQRPTFLLQGTGTFGGTGNWQLGDIILGNFTTVATTSLTGTGTTSASGIVLIRQNHNASSSKNIAVQGELVYGGHIYWEKWHRHPYRNNQAIYGSTTFYHLTQIATNTATTTFEAGAKMKVVGTLTLVGNSTTTPLHLRSSSNGSYWYIDPQGARTLQYLTVKDSYNENVTTMVCLLRWCTDYGSNVNWSFPNIIQISGIRYNDAGTTPRTTGGETISIYALGSTYSTTSVSGTGVWRYDEIVATSSMPIVVWANGTPTYYASAVALTDSLPSDVTSLNLYKDHVIVRSESDSAPITLTHLATYDSTKDSDIHLTASTTRDSLSITNGSTLYVWNGTQFQNAGSSTFSGSLVNNGIYLPSMGTTTLSGTARTLSGALSGTSSLGALYVTGSYTASNNASTSRLTIAPSASFTAPAHLTVAGNYTNNGTFNANGGTLYMYTKEATLSGVLTNASALHTIVLKGKQQNAFGTGGSVTTDLGSLSDSARAIASDDDTLYVTGSYNVSSGNFAYHTIAYDKTTGAVNWSTTTDVTTAAENPVKVVVDEGTVYVTGSCSGCGTLGNYAWYTIAYDNATGATLWASTTDITTGDDTAGGISVDSDTLYVSGYCQSCDGHPAKAFYLIAFNKTNGAFLWKASTYSGSGDDFGRDNVSDDDTVYVAGECFACVAGYTGKAFRLVAYNKTNGAVRWATSTDTSSGQEYVTSISLDADTLYVTGYTEVASLNYAYRTVAYNKSTGAVRWAITTDITSSFDYPYDSILDSNILYVTGVCNGCNGASSYAYHTIAYNKSTGAILQTITTDVTGGADYAYGITVDSDTLYVTGACNGCNGASGYAYHTVALDKTTGALIDGVNSYTFSNNASTTSLHITGASTTVIAPAHLTIGNTFENEGNFDPNSGTVTLTGTTHTLVGTTTFYNLKKVATTTATTTFEAGSKTTVTGTLTLTGIASTTPHNLRSSIEGTEWYLDPQGSRIVQNLSVKDSNNVNTQYLSCLTSMHGCINDGNNTNWKFTGAFIGSEEDHHFYLNQATTTFGDITLIDSLDIGTITATNNIRIAIASSTTNFRFDTTASVTFGGSASTKVGSVSYQSGDTVLVVDVTEDFLPGDTLVIQGVEVGSFNSASTETSFLMLYTDGTASGEPSAYDVFSIVITGLLTIADHSGGQVTNQFPFLNSDDVPLFAFGLTATGENATVTALTLDLTSVHNVDASRVTELRLYRDMDGSRTVSVGDTVVASGGTLLVDGYSGSISFNTPFLASTTRMYLVVADLSGVSYANMMHISLAPEDVVASGVSSKLQPGVSGTVSTVEHSKGRMRIGGGATAGGDTPVGGASATGIIRSGGTSGGGSVPITETTGETLPATPGSFAPTVTGTPQNQWTNGANALSSNNAYATAGTDGLAQSYSTFSFGIPGGNTVTGIIVKLEASASSAGGTIEVMLSWNSGTNYTSGAQTATLTTTDTVYTFGSESDLWGTSWTPAYFTDGTFIVRVIAHPSSNTVRLDALQVEPVHILGGGSVGGGDDAI
jgi:hypothetical protein